MAPTILSMALPMTLADGVTGKNNARSLRKGLLASLLMPTIRSGSTLAVRMGVLPKDFDSAGCTSLRVQQQSTASASVDILLGAFVSERAGQGPYVGYSEQTVTITPTAPDATNPRIDVVYARVLDQASIANDTNTDAVIDVLYGTPSSTPGAPSPLPDGAVKLAQILRPSTASRSSGYILSTDITDARQSACVLGGVRRMLAGDSLADHGGTDGELRYRQAVSPLPAMVDFWDSTQNLWRGTQGFTLAGSYPGNPDSNQNVSAVVSGGGNVLITVNVPDPGFPYRVHASTLFKITSIVAPTQINYYASVNYGPFAGAIATAGPGGDNRCPLIPTGSEIYTGASTVRLIIDVLGGGNVTWQADARNRLTVKIEPA